MTQVKLAKGQNEVTYFNDYFQFKLQQKVLTNKDHESQLIETKKKETLGLELIQSGLKTFCKVANGPKLDFVELDLEDREIFTLNGIEKYKNLQQINISYNKLTNLEILSNHKYQVQIEAHHNMLSNMLDFKPSVSIVHLDLSHNNIAKMEDMSKLQYLHTLLLSNNNIHTIEGIKKNTTLKTLDLSYNRLELIENCDDLNLTELNLEGNRIFLLTGLNKLKKLRTLKLSRNKIKKLGELKHLDSLRFLEISANDIKRIKELGSLRGLRFLTKLDLCHNICQKLKLYRQQVIYMLGQLRELDGVQIAPKEIVKSTIFYGHDMEEKRAIFENLLPNDQEQFVDRRITTSNMIDIESDSEPGDYDFFDKYDEEGNIIIIKPRNVSNNQQYPFTLKAAEGKVDYGNVKTMKLTQVAEETEWVRAKLEMAKSLQSPAKHSREINQMITASREGIPY